MVSALSIHGAEIADTTMRNLGEVVVTGVSAPVARNLQPYSVSVIGQERLESTGQTQVLSAISGMVPSLFVSERSIFGFGVSNGGSGHIKLRGVGGDRASAVLMMVDGQPQFAGIYSHHIADFYDKEYVERVEVLRGPGSVLYGSNAMAGAINVITKNPDKRGVRTTISSQYGSYNTWLSSATNTIRFGKFSLASLSYNRTDGTVDNFDFRQADGYLKLGYDFTRQWKASADYTLMHFKGNDPIYPRLSNPESTEIYRQSITRGEASVSVANSYSTTGGMLRAYYSYGSHYVDDPRHFHSLDDRFGIMAYQNFTPWCGASATVGFDFDRYSGKIPTSGGNNHTEGSMTTISRKRITEYSPYVTLSQSLAGELLNLNGGVRMANSDMFDTRWIPQFGFALNPGRGYTIKALRPWDTATHRSESCISTGWPTLSCNLNGCGISSYRQANIYRVISQATLPFTTAGDGYDTDHGYEECQHRKLHQQGYRDLCPQQSAGQSVDIRILQLPAHHTPQSCGRPHASVLYRGGAYPLG